jgi:hypothetical protein
MVFSFRFHGINDNSLPCILVYAGSLGPGHDALLKPMHVRSTDFSGDDTKRIHWLTSQAFKEWVNLHVHCLQCMQLVQLV